MNSYRVSAKEAGQRIDKYLVDHLRLGRNQVKDLIDNGRVRVNGKRVIISKWEMMAGDSVEVSVVKAGRGPKSSVRGRQSEDRRSEPKSYFIEIIHEDRDVIVVNKPSGAVIQPGRVGGGTYLDSLRQYLIRKHKGVGAFVSAVHRLDRETTGLMVFAKSKAGEKLIDQFKVHSIERAYMAIVDGAIENENGDINSPIVKGEFGHGKKVRIGREGEGKEAHTSYRVIERYPNATLVKIIMKTGRTHQARIHMASIGHPIVGDRVYGKPGGLKFPRQALHSSHLVFKHPAGGRQMKFDLDMPEDMEKLIDELRGS